MKLSDYLIHDLLRNENWQGAIDAVANSHSISLPAEGMKIQVYRTYSTAADQTRIYLMFGCKNYTWNSSLGLAVYNISSSISVAEIYLRVDSFPLKRT